MRIPIINSTSDDLTRTEKIDRTTNTNIAPAKAPATVAKFPHMPIAEEPSMITKATPRLEPDEMPIIEGPERGLLKHVCIKSPATDNAAPDSSPVSNAGKRVSIIINFDISFPCPQKVATVSSIPIGTLPANKPIGTNMISSTTREEMEMK